MEHYPSSSPAWTWRQSGLTQTTWVKIHGMSRNTIKYRKQQDEKHIELLMREDLDPYAQPITRLPEPQQIVPLACSTDIVRIFYHSRFVASPKPMKSTATTFMSFVASAISRSSVFSAILPSNFTEYSKGPLSIQTSMSSRL